jgi:hypothetical protein
MRAIKIDVIKKQVYEIEIADDLHAFQEALACQWVEAVHLGAGETLWIDEEGWLHKPIGIFTFALSKHKMFSGNGIILQTTRDGKSGSTTLNLEFIQERVGFFSVVPMPKGGEEE